MGVHSFEFQNGELKLHGLQNAGEYSNEQPPILFIPGLWGQAEQFSEILAQLEPRKAFALSLRGRGQSSVPEIGYSLEAHASDIQAFLDQMNIDRVILASVSAGASYALTYAAQESRRIEKLLITDYPAISKSYPLQMIEGVLAQVKDLNISRTFLEGLQRESQALSLEYKLKQIKCSVVVFRGSKPGSYLTEENLKTYKNNLEQLKIETLSEVVHDPLESIPHYIQALTAQL